MGTNGFFEGLNSKSAFGLGLAGGLAIMFAVGFFILLALYAGGGDATNKVAGANTNVNTNVNAGTPTIPAPAPTAPTVQASDHTTGPENAKITMIEFSDIQCPFCSRFHPTVKQLLDEYGDDIRFVYRHFPLDSIHPQARPAAEATECLADQLGDDGFFAYLDALFAQQSLLSRDLYISEAVKLGANESQFTQCLDDGKFKQRVESDYQAGIAAGVRGTPSSFINGRNISGALPYEQVKAAVDALLNS